ncbi:hypothetical protein B0H16DRAFT_1685438 [Mycena metata]|uniref:Uncharacterized protein n=1 Tax=Mycena metata TaxID=1033252 RepID=A0AAD7JV85_9AGAR|nr:hypothetical protein B0H16DRAFT_1685438 [Mycena metata]
MLPFTLTHISAVAFAFALTAHAQVCLQCPDTDNIGRPVTGNTPLVPGAATADKHAATTLPVISHLTEVASVHRTSYKTIVPALSLDSDSNYSHLATLQVRKVTKYGLEKSRTVLCGLKVAIGSERGFSVHGRSAGLCRLKFDLIKGTDRSIRGSADYWKKYMKPPLICGKLSLDWKTSRENCHQKEKTASNIRNLNGRASRAS